LAAGEFDVFLTMDRGVQFQQNLQSLAIGILIIRAPSNRFEDLQLLISEVHNALNTIQSGQVLRVGSR
jgi:hypothetical protein